METAKIWITAACFLGIWTPSVVNGVQEFTHAHVYRHHRTVDRHKEDGLKCRLLNTMAWRECDKKLVCDKSCSKENNCMFPYCNARGLCECIQAFCRTDRMCYSFGISCHDTRPPKITLFPTNTTLIYKPNSSAQIVCEAEGNPSPVIKWYRNDALFMPSGNDNRVIQVPSKGTLLFLSTEEKDEGIYRCTADNGYGVSVSPKVHFRVAKLNQFYYQPVQTYYIEYGGDLTLSCVPPYSYPPATISWVIQSDDDSSQHVQTDGRVTMDLEGRLRIMNAEPADGKGGRPYTCIATNAYLRQSVKGPEYKVTVVGSIPRRSPVFEYWSSPSQSIVIKGETLKLALICGGYPLPTTHWSKLDGTKAISGTANLTNDQMIIPNVDVQDAGTYRARCVNTDSLYREKIFTVAVEAAPTWKTKPSDANISVGSNATIVCEAEGVPQPWVYWFVNGVELEKSKDPTIQSSRLQQVNGSAVIFTNLQLTDHMNIQCNATNRNGNLWADVYINVK